MSGPALKRLTLIAATLTAGCLPFPEDHLLPVDPFEDDDNYEDEYTDAPPCVPEFDPGQRLTLRIDSVYDPSSDFLYEERFALSTWDARDGGCKAVDGLDIGSVVTFTLRSEMANRSEATCVPYLASFSPEVVGLSDLDVGLTSQTPGVSIAAAFAKGRLDGHPDAVVTRELISPSGEPHAEPVERELPPLVMLRTIHSDDPFSRCGDAWVMRWEEAP